MNLPTVNRMRPRWLPAFAPAVSWIVVTAALAVAALLFSNADGVRRVSGHGAAAVQVEQAMSGASALRNAVARVVIASETGADVDLADLEAVQTEYRRRVAAMLEVPDLTKRGALTADTAVYDRVVTDFASVVVDGGDIDAAIVAVDTAYRSLVGEMVSEREAHVTELATAGATAGRAAGVARFFVAVLFPIALAFGLMARFRRMRAEARMEMRVEQERAKQRAKDEFIADLSHELRTPLTGIVGFAGALRAEDLSPNAREYVEIIASEGAELQRMVDDLIAVGRIQSGKVTYLFEDVDVRATVDAAVLPFRTAGASIEVAVAPAILRVDEGRFRQVVRNLVSNAVKYGGESIVVLGETDPQGRYVLSVIDDGPGVPAELIDRLFERYIHDGDAITKGSVGLGLAIARTFTEGMEGTLTYSREDGFTLFAVTLPLADVAAPVVVS